jgi:hypothetical protein
MGPRFQNPWLTLHTLVLAIPGTLGLKQRDAGATPTLLRAHASTEVPEMQQESGTDTSIVPVTGAAAADSATAVTCTLESSAAAALAAVRLTAAAVPAALTAGVAGLLLMRAVTPLHVAAMVALMFHLPST